MYAFKTVIGSLLMPLPVALLLCVLGVVFLARGRRNAGRTALASGVLLGFGLSLPPVGHLLLSPLEGRYPAVLDAATLRPAPRFVAVLGAGYQQQRGWPITAELTSVSLVRLDEGLRLWRQLPAARLILSGGNPPGRLGTGRGYAMAVAALGMPTSGALVNDTPLDTRAEIGVIRSEVADAPVLLVTSAAHMPRAMAYCHQFGVRAIAAPTGYLTQPSGGWSVTAFIPSSSALQKSEIALHEYWGLLSQLVGGP